jgi:aldehyde:ferredoxin oxidoreductase
VNPIAFWLNIAMRKDRSYGYAGRTLYINLEELAICSKAVTAEMKEVFTGGRGFCLWLLWNGVEAGMRWDDPCNEIVIAGGPIGGITQYPGSGKCTVMNLRH